MAKQPKKQDLIELINNTLVYYWEEILKKLEIDRVHSSFRGITDDLEIPPVSLTSKASHVNVGEDCLEDEIRINYNIVRRAYLKKEEERRGAKVRSWTVLSDDIIHESIHLIQGKFYDIFDTEYDLVTEGLPLLVSTEILLEGNKQVRDPKVYEFIAGSIADCFVKSKERYFYTFDLPEIDLKARVKKAKKDPKYKPDVSLMHAKGFLEMCKRRNKGIKNYSKFLSHPFKNKEFEDPEGFVHEYISTITDELKINKAMKELPEIINEPHLLHGRLMVAQEAGKISQELVEKIQNETSLDKDCFYLPHLNIIYLGVPDRVLAAEEAMHCLHNSYSNEKAQTRTVAGDILSEALGFFGSKLIFPKRKPETEKNKNVLKLARTYEQSVNEIASDEKSAAAVQHGIVRSENQPQCQAIHKVGYQIGDILYQKYKKGSITRQDIKKILKIPTNNSKRAVNAIKCILNAA